MKKSILSAMLMMATLVAFAQQKIIIHGKINLLSKSKTVKISGLPDALINADGSFETTGEIKEPDVALIATDGSGASAMWLEGGTYNLNCKEILMNGSTSVLMRTPKLVGPSDAMIYNDFVNARYNGFLNNQQKDEKQVLTKSLTEAQKTANRENQGKLAFQYADSIITKHPDSKTLPAIIRNVKYYVGDAGTKSLIKKLSPSLQISDEIKQLQKGIQRNEAIVKDNGFENFMMKTVDGKDFRLTDLKNKKFILIDFWASDCGPCRITHPKLIELYKKYAEKGLEIVSISLDSDKAKWEAAIQEDNIGNWVNVSELKNWETSLVKKYAISYIPFRFLLDGNYKVLSHDDDGQINVTASTVEQELKRTVL